MAEYLEAALEDGDPALIATALGDIARAKGMSEIARETGLGRESLYKALSPDGNPELSTVLKVVRAPRPPFARNGRCLERFRFIVTKPTTWRRRTVADRRIQGEIQG